jgi:hypothetical protein
MAKYFSLSKYTFFIPFVLLRLKERKKNLTFTNIIDWSDNRPTIDKMGQIFFSLTFLYRIASHRRVEHGCLLKTHARIYRLNILLSKSRVDLFFHYVTFSLFKNMRCVILMWVGLLLIGLASISHCYPTVNEDSEELVLNERNFLSYLLHAYRRGMDIRKLVKYTTTHFDRRLTRTQ